MSSEDKHGLFLFKWNSAGNAQNISYWGDFEKNKSVERISWNVIGYSPFIGHRLSWFKSPESDIYSDIKRPHRPYYLTTFCLIRRFYHYCIVKWSLFRKRGSLDGFSHAANLRAARTGRMGHLLWPVTNMFNKLNQRQRIGETKSARRRISDLTQAPPTGRLQTFPMRGDGSVASGARSHHFEEITALARTPTRT